MDEKEFAEVVQWLREEMEPNSLGWKIHPYAEAAANELEQQRSKLDAIRIAAIEAADFLDGRKRHGPIVESVTMTDVDARRLSDKLRNL